MDYSRGTNLLADRHHDGNSEIGLRGSRLEAEFINMLGDELVALLEAADIEPDYSDRTQVAQAIEGIAGRRFSSLAAALAADLNIGTLVRVEGYAAPGDGGGFIGIAREYGDAGFPRGGRIQPTHWPYRAAAWGVLPSTSAADNSARLQQCVNFANGAPIDLPAGEMAFSRTVTYAPRAASGVWMPGIRLRGAGMYATVLDNQVNGPLIDVRSGSTPSQFYGVIGNEFSDFKITRRRATTNGIGVQADAIYNTAFRNLWVERQSADGVRLTCLLGDNDAANQVLFQNCRIEMCARWGINARPAANKNEISFIRLEQVFIQYCGTANNSYQPSSGGLQWKGQIIEIIGGAFTLNYNCAFWVPGEAGLAQTVRIDGSTFENNHARAVFVRGIKKFDARFQVYQNSRFPGVSPRIGAAVEFEGGQNTIRDVDISKVVIRQASTRPEGWTAFKISGGNAVRSTCRVREVIWDVFPDALGNFTRFDGWDFDSVTNNGVILVGSSATATLKPHPHNGLGDSVPMRLRGTGSTSGEWVAYKLGNNGLALQPAVIATLVPNTHYCVYLYDNNGVPTLEVDGSGQQPVPDVATGYRVKPYDPTRTYVGRIKGGAEYGTLATSGTGFLNPAFVPSGQVGLYARMWVDGSGNLRILNNNTDPDHDTAGSVVGGQG